jgi:hypothetical protein
MLFHLTIGIPIGDENRGASSGDGSAPEEIGALFPRVADSSYDDLILRRETTQQRRLA